MAYDLNDPFSVCFNILKLRYASYDESLDGTGFLLPTDKVNVFINLETVLNNLSMIKDIDKKILLDHEFPTIMISNILNLAAHYKRFFIGNGLNTRVFIYYTDTTSTKFQQTKYNDDYRSYYINKYLTNPRYSYMTELLNKTIFPDAKTIAEFCPNVHVIGSKNMDGSMIPYIIAKSDESYKNLIIGGDIYDTQYAFYDKFMYHYIRKTPIYASVSWTIKGYLKEIYKREVDQTTEVNLFSNLSFYLILLAVNGEKYRSIDPVTGIGPATVQKMIQKAIDERIITNTISSIDMISNIFTNESQKRDIISNFHSMSIMETYMNLSESDKFDIVSQIKDRFDNNSLIELNNTRFYYHQLILESLTK